MSCGGRTWYSSVPRFCVTGSFPWHLIARILHKDSQVWIEDLNSSGKLDFRILGPADVRNLGTMRAGKAA